MRQLLILFLLFFSVPVFAVDYFYYQNSGWWHVYGHPGSSEPKLNPACIAETKWEDGSYMNLIQDLADGELHIEFHNNEWDVVGTDHGKEFEFTMNMYGNNKSTAQSWKAYFIMTDKNTISVRGLDYKTFLPAFMNYSLMKFIMPGNIANAEVNLNGTTKAVNLMTECLKKADKGIPQNNNKSDSLNSRMSM